MIIRLFNWFRLKKLHIKYSKGNPSAIEKECLICDYFLKYLFEKKIINDDEDLMITVIGECRHPKLAQHGIRISNWSLSEGCKFLFLHQKRQTTYKGKRIIPYMR